MKSTAKLMAAVVTVTTTGIPVRIGTVEEQIGILIGNALVKKGTR